VKRSVDILGLLLVVVGFSLAAAAYSRLPDPMPSHWDMAGRVNGWLPQPWGAFGLPGIMALVWLFFLALPKISPRGFDMEPFLRAWGFLRAAILAFLLLTEILVLPAASTGRLSSRVLLAGLGLLFMVIGNFLGKVTRNFFVGIRTPWTIASEEVWNRTHRVGGKLLVIAGLIGVLSALFDLTLWPLVWAVLAAGAVSILYSYVIYKRIEGLLAPRPSP
jgi:uncharacterized membrane protein